MSFVYVKQAPVACTRIHLDDRDQANCRNPKIQWTNDEVFMPFATNTYIMNWPSRKASLAMTNPTVKERIGFVLKNQARHLAIVLISEHTFLCQHCNNILLFISDLSLFSFG